MQSYGGFSNLSLSLFARDSIGLYAIASVLKLPVTFLTGNLPVTYG